MQCLPHEPVRVPDAVQRERMQTSVRSLRKLDCGAGGAPLVRGRVKLGIRSDPGSQRITRSRVLRFILAELSQPTKKQGEQ